MTERSWFAVKSKPRCEAQASAWLAHRGLEVCFPRVPASKRRGSLGRLEPLFPGYFFCRVAQDTSEWTIARWAPGVAYFLGSSGEPTALPDDLVDTLKARSDQACRTGWKPSFKPLDRVLIERGPFAGLEGLFDGALSANGRARVLVEIVSRLVPVDLDAGDLARAV